MSSAGRNVVAIMRRRLGSHALRIDSFMPAMNHVIVKRILHVWSAVRYMEETVNIGLVLREQNPGRGIELQLKFAQRGMLRHDAILACERQLRFRPIAFARPAPRPRVAKP